MQFQVYELPNQCCPRNRNNNNSADLNPDRFTLWKDRFKRRSIHGLRGAACVALGGLTPFWAPPALGPHGVGGWMGGGGFADVKDAFHRIQIIAWLRLHFVACPQAREGRWACATVAGRATGAARGGALAATGVVCLWAATGRMFSVRPWGEHRSCLCPPVSQIVAIPW